MAYNFKTDTVNRWGVDWKAEIYKDGTSQTEKPLTGSGIPTFLLRRGKSNPSKFDNFQSTQISFTVLDVDKELRGYLEGDLDGVYRCEIKKGLNTYFKGHILLEQSRSVITENDPILKLTAYDNFKFLKDIKDVDQFSAPGLMRVSEILREILNKLGYGLDLKFYQNIYATPVGETIKPIYDIKLDVTKYYTQEPNTSFYDILEDILKTLDFNLFQYDGDWIFRQNSSIKPGANAVKVTIIDQSTGSWKVAYTTVTERFFLDDLQWEPVEYALKKINKVIMTSEGLRIDNRGDVGWENPNFKLRSQGWTINNGSPNFTGNSLKMESGDEVQQETISSFQNDALGSPDKVEINYRGVSALFLNPGDGIRNGNVVEIKYQDTLIPQNFWLDGNGVWQTSQVILGIELLSGYYRKYDNGDYTSYPTLNTYAQAEIVYKFDVDLPTLIKSTSAYSSDFSNGSDGFSSTNGTLSGNVDGIEGENNTLEFWADNTDRQHYIERSFNQVNNKVYKITFDYYIPSDNTNVDGIRIIGGIATIIQGSDIGEKTGSWETKTIYVESDGVNMGFSATAEGADIFVGANSSTDDLFYIKNVVSTENQQTQGKVLIILHPGAPTINDYDWETEIQHIVCNLKVPYDSELRPNGQAQVTSSVKEFNEKSISIKIHDAEPFSDTGYKNAADSDNFTTNWKPDDLALLEQISKKIVKFNCEDQKGIKVAFSQGKQISYLSLGVSELNEITDMYFLPCYEEIDLIDNVSKMVLLQHEESAESVTIKKEFKLS